MNRTRITDASQAAKNRGHGAYAIDWNTAYDRIDACKSIVLNTNQRMDEERLKILKAAYEENAGEEPILMRAKFFEKLLLNKTLYLDENPIVGTLTSVRRGVYPYPEWFCDWIKDEMDMVKVCSLGEIVIPEESKALMMDIYKQWKGHTLTDLANRNYKNIYGESPLPYFRSSLLYDGSNRPQGSGAPNHRKVLEKGFRGIIEEVDKKISELNFEQGDQKKLDFL